jgi:tetratricopeptide (TPR) repeat protein
MDTEERLREARRCHDEGRFGAAADLLLAAFRAEPERFEVAREIGRLLRAVGDPAGAADYLKRAWLGAPADGLTVAELVLALHDLGRRDEAVQVMLSSLDAGLEQTGFVECLAARS